MASACLDILGADLEQLVWQDIQSTGLDKLCTQVAARSGDSSGATTSVIGFAASHVPSSASPTASSMSDHDRVSAVDALPHASGDAGSGSSVFALSSAVDGAAPPAGSPVAGAGELGPFAALEHHHCLSSAPSAGLPAASLVTHKTRALAAAAGSLRTGAVGSGLRLAALMCRSNSGGLADALMAEQVRAESGLLTAGVARSDSVPEMGAAPSVEDLAELVSLRDLDFLAGMPSAAGLPSLSMLFGERPDFIAAQTQTQHAPTAAAAAAAAPGTDALWEEAAAAAAPAWMGGGGSRVMARPPSFNANTAAALFGGGGGTSSSSALQLPVRPSALFGLPLQASGLAGGALQPPSLVDYSQLAPLSSTRDPAGAGPTAALGFDGLAAAARLPLLMDRQDTFEMLMRQVDQELMAEAGIRQYAALEIDTMDVPATQVAAAAAAAAALFSGAGAAATEPAPAPATHKRRSAFEGHRAALLSPDVSAVSTVDAAGAPVLDSLGPSFGAWAPPAAAAADPSSSSQASGATAGGTPSPFCLPVSTGLQLLDGGVDGSATTASAGTESGASVLGKQEVARYKRLITCKTYLKRLNITQPMAEHLLPLHDLNPAGRPRTSADGGSDDDARRGGSSYDQLFKEQVVLVDEAGGSFRVQYEGVACNAQKHLRLTCGWRDYIRHHNVEVGDTILFERRGQERSVIYVTLVKACDAPVELAPEGKRRRVGRKEAVQRLQ